MAFRTRQQLKDMFLETDPEDYVGDLVDSFGIGVARQIGNIYYTDSANGSDGNDGDGPDDAFETLQAGIDACTANQGDVVIKMRGGEEVTAAVNFNKSGILVIAADYGASPQATGELFSIYAGAGYVDGPVANVTERCTIVGLGFVSRDTGALFWDGAAMLIGGLATAAPFGVHLLRCRFPKWGWDNRMGLAIEGSSDVLVEECYFEGVGSAFETGIYVQGAIQNLEIRKCRFRDCTYAITHGAFAGGGPHCLYLENVCEDSKLLDSGGNAATGLISGNRLETATGAGSYDGAVATLQGYGLNFSGNHYSE